MGPLNNSWIRGIFPKTEYTESKRGLQVPYTLLSLYNNSIFVKNERKNTQIEF